MKRPLAYASRVEAMRDSGGQWWLDRLAVVAFARALVETDQLGDEHAVIDFFEEPQRWAKEFQLWSSLGRPDGPGHPRFDELVRSSRQITSSSA
jgi:hypothetical protein